MGKLKFKSGIVVLLLMLLSVVLDAQNDAGAILRGMDDVIFSIKDKTVNVKMVLLNLKSNKEKVKEATLIQKGTAMKLFRYTAPSSDAGIATLTLPNKEVYLYLPMFKKPKKITNLAESSVVNKSDFSIEDAAQNPYSEVYTPELINSDGDSYTLNLIPKNTDSGARRMVVKVNKEHYYPEQFDFYDKKGNVVKRQLYHHIQVSGHWVADTVSMEDIKRSHKTTLHMSDIIINQGLKDELFAVENMVIEE